MIAALKQVEAGRGVEDVAREVGVSKHTIYAWKAKYGGMDVSQAQEAKQLRDENTRLRKLVADLTLDKEALQSVIRNACTKDGGRSVRSSFKKVLSLKSRQAVVRWVIETWQKSLYGCCQTRVHFCFAFFA